MKRWQIIVLCVAAFVLLAIRGAYIHLQRGTEEKDGYLRQLNFEFSGKVDSVAHFRKNRGVIYFHITGGNHNREKENALHRSLKYNGSIRLMWERNGKNALFFLHADPINVGDSLVVNTARDQLLFFRGNELIVEAKVKESLVGRSF